ncbi:ImmA/IrrE family metallo-endopeptidase [Staphylococcus epidermidis]|uniref:ImmA/IrrE family metallo-endopeptidase n=1 Tax=Staphylococcus epidermidis TaxID=1282 RepID=UPI00189AF687|nr:ImmA/IrrE family metallo-endopeptidase [Staphylococcus epidermidis]MCG1613926.1 ImmA/IrrE family metallo-endopeptidase [Staphylococcus epidermidis]
MSKRLSKEQREKCAREVEPIVLDFINKYNITQPIEDSFKFIEDKIGYFIVSKKVDANISGFQYIIGNDKFIFINNNDDLGRQNQSLWHEVYHLYTGEGMGISEIGSANYNILECKADQFASQILMNRRLVKEFVKNANILDKGFFTKKDVIQMQQYFRVSFNNMCYVLNELYGKKFLKGSYFQLGKIENRKKLLDITKRFGFDTRLSEIPEDNYISPKLFEYLSINMRDKKISAKRVNDIINFIELELGSNNE